MRRTRRERIKNLLWAPVIIGGSLGFAVLLILTSFRSSRHRNKYGDPEDAIH
jgi:hypothetical protein